MNMDLILQTERVPGAGESILGETYSQAPGGKGANQAVAAARAGADVFFVGKVGPDENGTILRENLIRAGIDVSLLSTAARSKTGIAAILVEPSGENRIIVFPGANLDLTPPEIDRAFSIRASSAAEGTARLPYDALLLSFEIPVAIIDHTVRTAKEKNIPVYVDAGPVRDVDLDVFKAVCLFSPNRTELEALTGSSCLTMDGTLEAAAELFRGITPEHLVIKCGSEGALYFGAAEQYHVPAFSVQAVDGTAAGDAFTAGLTVEHLRTGNMAETLRFGSAAGALAASKLGAQPSLPERYEVEAFLAR